MKNKVGRLPPCFARGKSVLGAALLALLCASCEGPIVKQVQTRRDFEGRTDGAIVGYYLPKALWKVAASYDSKTGLITITADAKPTTIADTDARMHYLSYAHAKLSDDDITIQLNGGMLSSVASKASDQSVKVAEAVGTLISEVGTAKSTFQTAAAPKMSITLQGAPAPTLIPPEPQCTTDLQSEATINLSAPNEVARRIDTLWGEHCALVLEIKIKRLPVRPFKIAEDPALSMVAAQDLRLIENVCERAVCFRPSQVVEASVTVGLQSDLIDDKGAVKLAGADKTKMNYVRVGKAGMADKVPYTFAKTFNPFVVPSAKAPAGFVEFGRRAFVENHTSITFTDGVVSEFKSTDPSIIAGAITLSTDLLKAVVLTVPIVR